VGEARGEGGARIRTFYIEVMLTCSFTMKIIPVLIINLRGSNVEMADFHATTILHMDFRNIMY
jgi:hypothetical protein